MAPWQAFPKRLNWETFGLKIKQRLFFRNRWLEFCPMCEDSSIWHSRRSSVQAPSICEHAATSWGPSYHRRVCAPFVNTCVAYLGIWQACQETSSHFPSYLWTPHTNYQLFGCNFFLMSFLPFLWILDSFDVVRGKKNQQSPPPAIICFLYCI